MIAGILGGILIYYVGIGLVGYIGFGSYLGGALSSIYKDISPRPKSVTD